MRLKTEYFCGVSAPADFELLLGLASFSYLVSTCKKVQETIWETLKDHLLLTLCAYYHEKLYSRFVFYFYLYRKTSKKKLWVNFQLLVNSDMQWHKMYNNFDLL